LRRDERQQSQPSRDACLSRDRGLGDGENNVPDSPPGTVPPQRAPPNTSMDVEFRRIGGDDAVCTSTIASTSGDLVDDRLAEHAGGSVPQAISAG